MLTVEECKEHLGDLKLTNKQIEEIRDALCAIIDNVLENYLEEINK